MGNRILVQTSIAEAHTDHQEQKGGEEPGDVLPNGAAHEGKVRVGELAPCMLK